MNGRKAKRLRREIWGERKDWDLEEGLHPRARSYVISFNCTKLIPKVVEDGEGNVNLLQGTLPGGGKFAYKFVEWEYYGPIYDGDRREYQRLKRRKEK